MRITLVEAHNPGPYTGAGNNTYLVGAPNALLIDAGVGEARHLDDLATALTRHNARLATVVVTHGHSDHASGARAIAARWPLAQFFKMPWPGVDDRFGVAWRPLRDGEELHAGDDLVQGLHTPGHAPDHLALWHAQTRTLFAGDLVTRQGTVVIPASHGGDLGQYLSSIHRVIALAPAMLLPAHGSAIDDPPVVLQRYLRHRAKRDEQILAAVQAGRCSVESIVDTVYDELEDALKGAARETVLAHLIRLEADGSVVRDADSWRVR